LRKASIEQVVEQIKKLMTDLESHKFNIWDDNFTDSPERLESLILELEKERIVLKETSVFCRTASYIDPQVFPLLKKLGVTTIVTGFESGSERILQYLKGPKTSIKYHHLNCMRARKFQMNVLASVMFGVPGETMEDMNQTLELMDWKVRNKISGTLWAYVATPLPGSEFWEIALARGKVHPTMNFNSLSFNNFENPLLLDENIPLTDFLAIIKKARALCALDSPL